MNRPVRLLHVSPTAARVRRAAGLTRILPNWACRDDGLVRRTTLAAEGWLALGAPRTAWEALRDLRGQYRHHPAVLHQRARVLVALGKLAQAKAAVRHLARLAPDYRLALIDDPALEPIWL